MKILIPTCRQLIKIQPLLSELNNNCPADTTFHASCFPEPAAINRNICLTHVAKDEIAVMIDDDIEGFYPGWIDDLTAPLGDESVVMVSARLLDQSGVFGPTCSRCYDPEPMEIEVESNGQCVLPTAAIAFRHRGHLFDEHYLGSGWEDNDWCFEYLKHDPSAKFIQSNRCKLIHRNEMKSQGGKIWEHNQMYFYNKWRPWRVTA